MTAPHISSRVTLNINSKASNESGITRSQYLRLQCKRHALSLSSFQTDPEFQRRWCTTRVQVFPLCSSVSRFRIGSLKPVAEAPTERLQYIRVQDFMYACHSCSITSFAMSGRHILPHLLRAGQLCQALTSDILAPSGVQSYLGPT